MKAKVKIKGIPHPLPRGVRILITQPAYSKAGSALLFKMLERTTFMDGAIVLTTRRAEIGGPGYRFMTTCVPHPKEPTEKKPRSVFGQLFDRLIDEACDRDSVIGVDRIDPHKLEILPTHLELAVEAFDARASIVVLDQGPGASYDPAFSYPKPWRTYHHDAHVVLAIEPDEKTFTCTKNRCGPPFTGKIESAKRGARA